MALKTKMTTALSSIGLQMSSGQIHLGEAEEEDIAGH